MPSIPAEPSHQGCHYEPAAGLLAFAIGLYIAAGAKVLVHELPLDRAHWLERDWPLVVNCRLGSLVGGGPERHHHGLAVALAVERNSIRQVLDRVDRLAVVPDQEAQLLAGELSPDPFVVLAYVDARGDADCLRNALEQFLDPS
jgi:hypothetical protein